jgi:cellulose synthase/poly-beta-1,6-N-acetylglucosamine synthase-like glycosyltransferase
MVKGHSSIKSYQTNLEVQNSTKRLIQRPLPHLYASIFGTWLLSLIWFQPRLWKLLEMTDSVFGIAAIVFFIVFTEIAWLYALFNVFVVIFAVLYRRFYAQPNLVYPPIRGTQPAVAILYTTCNDFVEESLNSCLAQDYPNFKIYILDDSSSQMHMALVDDYARRNPERVQVVRRANRNGFKAGNLNHGLSTAAIQEPYFALVDADEILPVHFLKSLVPRLQSDQRCAFIQANHQSNPNDSSALAQSLGVGIDIHWRWYHPLRNCFGFVMLLGHGALIRRACWQAVGGFPELVSEDLAFALRLRERGWRGYFAADVICYENFPEDMRAFRVRHMKWTRGTCEFLRQKFWDVIISKRISLVEKLDILFPTLSLPLSPLFFLFILDANLILINLFGQAQPVQLEFLNLQFNLPTRVLGGGFEALGGLDFFFMTALAIVAPILCFVIELWRKPMELLRFIGVSVTVYGALGGLSSLGVLFYLLTGKAVFHATADRSNKPNALPTSHTGVPFAGLKQLLVSSHPDHWVVRGFELSCGLAFCAMCLQLVQVSFFGLAVAQILHPILHRTRWEHPLMQKLVQLPLAFMLLGFVLRSLVLLPKI